MNTSANMHELERIHGVTWSQLVELEPRLNELLWQARQAGAQCVCREEAASVFGPLRNTLAELIGFRGQHWDHSILGSLGAYEVGYWRLYHAVACLLPKPSLATSSPAFALKVAG